VLDVSVLHFSCRASAYDTEVHCVSAHIHFTVGGDCDADANRFGLDDLEETTFGGRSVGTREAAHRLLAPPRASHISIAPALVARQLYSRSRLQLFGEESTKAAIRSKRTDSRASGLRPLARHPPPCPGI